MVAYTDARRRLSALVRGARPGGPVVVNLCGPVGVGKSRLAAALGGTVLTPAAGPMPAPRTATAPLVADRTGGLPLPADRTGTVPLVDIRTGAVPLVDARTGAVPLVADGGAAGPLVVDGVDHDAHAEAVRELLAGVAPGTCVLVVGRRPLVSRPGWSGLPVETVPLSPWSRTAVRRFARSRGVRDPARLDLVADLSGGIPLIADRLLCALAGGGHADVLGGPADVLGGLADVVAGELLRRLAVETAGPPPGALPVVATVGGADADLLAALVQGTPADFDRLRALSVVRPEAHGLVVVEPFRTIFELAYRWRHPVTARTLLDKGSAHRRRQITRTGDPGVRAKLADQVLHMSAHPQVRPIFFPPVPGPLRVRAAEAADEDDIVRLTRQWAGMEALDPRRADRMLELWMTTPGSLFDLVVDGDDRPLGMTNMTGIGAGAAPLLEALLQQHAPPPAPSPGGDGSAGVVLGMLVTAPRRPAARAVMLRHILATAMASGRVVVSTPWAPYQRLSERMGLVRMGETRDDLFRCGRRSGVFARTFTPRNLPGWLRQLERGAVPAEDDALAEAVRAALARLGDPRRPAEGPPAAMPALGSPEAIAAFVRRQVEALANSGSPVDQEAGRVLSLYYLRGGIAHEAAAHRLHLSRATYFRRLDHGVRRLTEALRAATR
ncbi:hypothetical protein ABZU32_11650 [Sphaerisporangium sp. NPDC005288]|uniref:hypothetical protein n=1 Tax=Sphaerisporangium sp. NPDC005288 TaxID=3155114 RepID=UPI0033AB2A41